jgi:hypothetical protein
MGLTVPHRDGVRDDHEDAMLMVALLGAAGSREPQGSSARHVTVMFAARLPMYDCRGKQRVMRCFRGGHTSANANIIVT